MKSKYLIPGIVLTLLVATLVSSCSQSDAKIDNAGAPSTQQGVTVRVQKMNFSSFVEAIQVTGIVKAYEDVSLSPEEGGVVKEWKVPKGQRVAKGQILAILKDDVLQASYDAASAQYKLSEINYEKQKSVFQEQAISELQMKSTEYNRDAAKAQSDLQYARLERARLRSPIDGILNDRFYDEGEFVPPAVPIAHIVNSNTVKIAAEVPEVATANLTVGAPAVFTVDAFPGDTLRGRVTFVAAAINPNNRTLPVEVVVSNPGNKLKPEMIARIRILRTAKKNALLLSESVIQQVDRNKYVVYVEHGGKAEERIVKLGGRQGNLVEIVDGLKAGDRVIVAGYQKLVNGQAVAIIG